MQECETFSNSGKSMLEKYYIREKKGNSNTWSVTYDEYKIKRVCYNNLQPQKTVGTKIILT